MKGGHRYDDELMALIVCFAITVLCVFVGAGAAAFVSSQTVLVVGVDDAVRATILLPRWPAEPRLAWPVSVQHQLPGSHTYWACTASSFAVVVSALVATIRRWSPSSVGLVRRRRLGVEARGRMATRRDLRPLTVPGSVSGRFVLGRAHGRLVATERPSANGRRGGRSRSLGNRSAVAVIGPSQCGKTSNVVCSILEWDGPAILSSVKNDLFEHTVRRRAQVGEVRVFDPLREVGEREVDCSWRRCGWSPLLSASTVGGAIAVANALLDAAPAEGMTNATYWTRKGEALLWPVLFAAAVGGRTMSDVVRWLALQDGEMGDRNPQKVAPSEVRTILQSATRQQPDGQLAQEARFALQQFDGFWLLNDRMRSDIFSTAQTLVQPWEDPRLASAAALAPMVDLDWLLSGSGRNTLYVSQPLNGAERLGVVFGGLLGDIVADQAYEVAKRSGCTLPDLLVVVDEAGNTPVRWLPQVASTCSGIGMSLVTVWQSKSQIDARYQSLADSVLTNHATKLFFAGTSDESTGRYASFLAGDEEVESTSTHGDRSSGRRSVSLSAERLPVISPSGLRRARPGHALLIHGTLPPAHLRGRVLSAERGLQAVAQGDAPLPADRVLPERLASTLEELRRDRSHSVRETLSC